MLNGLFSNFDTRIVSERQNLQTYKLLAQLPSEAVTHTTEELHCNYAIIFVRIIMCHFYDMLQHIISSVFVTQFMGDST